MALSEEAQREYDEALRRATIRNGSVLATRERRFGWQDFEATLHLGQCGGTSELNAQEDFWYEFAGTFAEAGDHEKHGVSLKGVSCQCGELSDREVRWTDYPSAMTEAVFGEAFGRR